MRTLLRLHRGEGPGLASASKAPAGPPVDYNNPVARRIWTTPADRDFNQPVEVPGLQPPVASSPADLGLGKLTRKKIAMHMQLKCPAVRMPGVWNADAGVHIGYQLHAHARSKSALAPHCATAMAALLLPSPRKN